MPYHVSMHPHLGLKHKKLRRDAEVPSRSSMVLSSASFRRMYSLDRITFLAGVVGPFTVLPQIYKIFVTHTAAGVSLTSWVLIFIVTLPWIFYGIAHRDRSIIVSFILWELVNIVVIVGVVMYG